MISGANVISCISTSQDDFLRMLSEVGKSIGLNDLATSQRIFDGVSNVWIRLVDLEEAGYEESDLKNIEGMLLEPARTVIMFEYDEGETAILNVLKVVNQIAQRWPIVFDNCYDRVYRVEEIADLFVSGKF